MAPVMEQFVFSFIHLFKFFKFIFYEGGFPMQSVLTAAACPEPSDENLFVCDFCHRPAEIDTEANVDGFERSVWLCGICIKSKMILKQWEVIS